MLYAPITPLTGLEHLDNWPFQMHMALAQYLIDQPDYYQWYRMYTGRLVDPSSVHVIVDNGTAEGVKIPFTDVVAVADSIGAAEVVMPDVMRDAAATMRATLQGYVVDMVPGENRMLVPQGSDWMSWTYCLSVFTDPQTIVARSLGIPKHLEALPGGRAHALQIIKDRGVDKRYDIHLLGIYRQPFAEVKRAIEVLPTIRSIDTAAPVAYAQHGHKLSDMKHFSVDWDVQVPRKLAEENLLSYQEYCRATEAPTR